MQSWVETARRIEQQLGQRLQQQRIPCFDYAIGYRGQQVAAGHGGWASLEDRLPLRWDSLFRLFSMTKPVTSVVALMLVEQGRIGLDDPISHVLPELSALCVFDGVEADGSPRARPPVNRVTLRHLLTHTAGFTYHFMTMPGPDGGLVEGPVQQLYRRYGIKPAAIKIAALPGDGAPVRTADELLRAVASIPLVDDPGVQFHYSIATDLVGLLIERLTATSLGKAFRTLLLDPLGMKDTGFSVPPGDLGRFTSNYRPAAQGLALVDAWDDSDYLQQPSLESGGGGLISTTADYTRFLEMLRVGGTFGGHRFLSAGVCEQMCRSQLTSQVLAPSNLEASAGTGFGLGLGIYEDRRLAHTTVPTGSLFWNGAAGTCCWIDPQHGVTAVVMTQLLENDLDRLDRVLHGEIYDEEGLLGAGMAREDVVDGRGHCT